MITDDEIQKLKAACLRLPETTVRQEELNVAGDPALMLERVCGFSSAKSATTGGDRVTAACSTQSGPSRLRATRSDGNSGRRRNEFEVQVCTGCLGSGEFA